MPRKASKNQPMLAGFDSLLEEIAPLPTNPSSDSLSASNIESKTVAESLALPAAELAPFPKEGDLVILVDSHSLIYQVFHALPSMTSPKGEEVGAIQGFLRDIANLLLQWKPDFLVCTFDASDTTFRNEIYDQYKANRDPMPEGLRAQLSMIHDCLGKLSIPKVTLPGYEADDIMATLASQAAERGAKVLLVTSDKDCRQLITDRVQC
jgi:DNA polymerase-1